MNPSASICGGGTALSCRFRRADSADRSASTARRRSRFALRDRNIATAAIAAIASPDWRPPVTAPAMNSALYRRRSAIVVLTCPPCLAVDRYALTWQRQPRGGFPGRLPLDDTTASFYADCGNNKRPNAFLFIQDDRHTWAHTDSYELKSAAAAAKFSPETHLHTARHSFITHALLDGVSTLEVSKMTGTPRTMIEIHYDRQVHATARERHRKAQMH